MSARKSMGVAERRARLVRRHLLTPAARATDPLAVAEALVALHSSDPVTVVLSLYARMKSATVESIERALYEDRSLMRILGMRRTLFVVAADLVPIVFSSCTRAIAARERKRLIRMVEDGGITKDGARWVRKAEQDTMKALVARGEPAAAAELSREVPQLREKVTIAPGKTWGGEFPLSTRILWLLAMDGRIVRGRPRGSWISGQYRWSPMDAIDPVPVDEARAELARRWLRAYGPATVADLKWWTGWTLGETRKALAALGPVEVDLEGTVGIVLADDQAPVRRSKPAVALLPALDPTVMGWAEREWYLGPHGPLLFDRNGNAGPTVWWDGRVVGGWGQRKDGEIAYRLLEDVGRDAVKAVEAEAERLQRWLGAMRFTPRFNGPLGRELAA